MAEVRTTGTGQAADRGREPAARRNAVDAAFEIAADLAASARAFLGSEKGHKLRRTVATAVIVGAPLLSQLPFLRRSKAARLLQTAAVGTFLIKGAEWLRDWDPGAHRATVA